METPIATEVIGTGLSHIFPTRVGPEVRPVSFLHSLVTDFLHCIM